MAKRVRSWPDKDVTCGCQSMSWLVPVQLPAKALGRATEDDTTTWVHIIHAGDLDEAPGSGLMDVIV